MPRYKIFSQRMEKNRTPISRKATPSSHWPENT
jgi:hypothetical protein